MQKQPPSIGRLLVAVGFTLSCFGLLLFLWAAFGGPIPFSSKSYRFTADFPEATQLAVESDVRVGGVSVGKVKTIELPPTGNATRAEIEIEPQYAPIYQDARAILRQKTLLGETYVGLTRGSPEAGGVPEEGHLDAAQTQDSVQIDEIFNAVDEEFRNAFRLWMKNAAIAIRGRGLDLNDSFGNFGPFVADASDILETLDRQGEALSQVVRGTGDVFAALTQRERALAGAITGSNATFRALASQDEALAETFRIFPTFQRESRLTFARLETFANNTNPLIVDLKKVAPDITPTLRKVRQLAPPLKSLLRKIGALRVDDLVDVSCGTDKRQKQGKIVCREGKGLPGLRKVLDAFAPVFRGLDPFLANLNPIVRYLNAYRSNAKDFLAGPGAALAGTLRDLPAGSTAAPRHVLRQFSYISHESLSIHPLRHAANRGNGYLLPDIIGNARGNTFGGVFPSFDCNNTGVGEVPAQAGLYFPLLGPTLGVRAACTIQPRFPSQFGGEQAPQIFADP
jgi:phospholipid/cholesterol/gamma-HCH transport system substrate-binding protein